MRARRQRKGKLAYESGQSAEHIIAREYNRRGAEIADRRFRGSTGEIDLIARSGPEVIFVEVKKARDFATAAAQLGQHQMRRILEAASEFLEQEPLGQLTPVRFDVALVGATGNFEIIENAFGDV